MKRQPVKKIYNVSVIIIIIGLLGVIVFREPEMIVKPDNEKVLRDSIALLQTTIDSSRFRQTRIQASYDSLLHLDPQILYRTHEKYKFIYSVATPTQLDSIIRTNWKTNLGHY
jgi:hypothetical protein